MQNFLASLARHCHFHRNMCVLLATSLMLLVIRGARAPCFFLTEYFNQ